MEPIEKIIAIATQMNSDGIVRNTCNLIFTNFRIIAIKIEGSSELNFLLFGPIGYIIGERKIRKRSADFSKLTLSEILQRNDGKKFFYYAELESILIKPRRFFSSWIIINEKWGKKKYWSRNNKDITKAYKALKSIKIDGEKLNISVG